MEHHYSDLAVSECHKTEMSVIERTFVQEVVCYATKVNSFENLACDRSECYCAVRGDTFLCFTRIYDTRNNNGRPVGLNNSCFSDRVLNLQENI